MTEKEYIIGIDKADTKDKTVVCIKKGNRIIAIVNGHFLQKALWEYLCVYKINEAIAKVSRSEIPWASVKRYCTKKNSGELSI